MSIEMTDLRRLVGLLAARGVVEFRLSAGEEVLELRLRSGTPELAPAPAPCDDPAPVVAAGPGRFYHRHPQSGAELPCLAAGDFLFPACPAPGAGDVFLAGDGVLVGYATPLLRPAPQHRGCSA